MTILKDTNSIKFIQIPMINFGQWLQEPCSVFTGTSALHSLVGEVCQRGSLKFHLFLPCPVSQSAKGLEWEEMALEGGPTLPQKSHLRDKRHEMPKTERGDLLQESQSAGLLLALDVCNIVLRILFMLFLKLVFKIHDHSERYKFNQIHTDSNDKLRPVVARALLGLHWHICTTLLGWLPSNDPWTDTRLAFSSLYSLWQIHIGPRK